MLRRAGLCAVQLLASRSSPASSFTDPISPHLFSPSPGLLQLVEGYPEDGWVVVGGLDGKSLWITYNFALLRALQVGGGRGVG